MIKPIKNYFTAILIIAITAASCSVKTPMTDIKGVIKSGNDKMLYLEKRGMTNVVLLDSLKLDAKGGFSFSVETPSSPELYQLRIAGQSIVLAVDSLSSLNIEADAINLFDSYRVDNSEVNSQMKELLLKRNQAAVKIKSVMLQHKQNKIDDQTFISETNSAINDYKELATSVILNDMSSMAAYFALFLKIDNLLIFNPYDKSDYRIFAAVASTWKECFSDSERAKHLEMFTLTARNVMRGEQDREKWLENIEVKDNIMPDIVLNDVFGARTSLSSLEGKVVLLDFTAYQLPESAQRNQYIKTIYDKYKQKGFEIYQISFDSDEHFWKTYAKDFPWTTVHDPASINSHLLKTYNVGALPTAFLINRKGQLSVRLTDESNVDDEIIKLI